MVLVFSGSRGRTEKRYSKERGEERRTETAWSGASAVECYSCVPSRGPGQGGSRGTSQFLSDVVRAHGQEEERIQRQKEKNLNEEHSEKPDRTLSPWAQVHT